MQPTHLPHRSRLLLLPEVAQRLRRSPAQIRWMVHTKQIVAPAKISNRLVWSEDQLEEWILDQFPKTGA